MARYIDADELTEEIKSLSVMLGDENVFKTAKESVLRIIDEQPTADVVEVKHGEWEKTKVVNEEYGYVEVYYQHKDCKISPAELYKCPFEHCPRCGAKMDGKRK